MFNQGEHLQVLQRLICFFLILTTCEVIEMSNNENIVKINSNFKLYEIDGKLYSLEELKGFIKSSKELAQKCERQSRFIKALKLNNAQTTEERNSLIDELTTIKRMSMFEFSNTYSNAEQQEADGRRFARALLGGA